MIAVASESGYCSFTLTMRCYGPEASPIVVMASDDNFLDCLSKSNYTIEDAIVWFYFKDCHENCTNLNLFWKTEK